MSDRKRTFGKPVYPRADTLNRRLVGGEILEGSLLEFAERCSRFIESEMEKVSYDTALIAVLCDAVRLAREYEASAARPEDRG